MNQIEEFENEPTYPRRSYQTCKYWFGIVINTLSWNVTPDGERITPDQWHEYLKWYLEADTTRVNSKVMADYIMAVQELAARVFNIDIPDPDQLYPGWQPWHDHSIIR